MRKLLLLPIIAATLLTGSALYGHHSYAATYDVTKEIKLEGKLVQFVLRNPHTYVTMQAPDSKGVTQRWSIEWAGSAQLGSQGIKQDTLKIGDEITVVGRPSRVPGEFRALLVNLKRPSDGFTWGSRTGEQVD
ncbi:MAG TPA: DUF6152 family protein [Terriglobia bacterium]|jgi:hypothetical protein